MFLLSNAYTHFRVIALDMFRTSFLGAHVLPHKEIPERPQHLRAPAKRALARDWRCRWRFLVSTALTS